MDVYHLMGPARVALRPENLYLPTSQALAENLAETILEKLSQSQGPGLVLTPDPFWQSFYFERLLFTASWEKAFYPEDSQLSSPNLRKPWRLHKNRLIPRPGWK